MKTIHPISLSLFSIGLVALSFLALPTGSQAQTQTCYDTNIVKFWNPPNVDGGLDVKDSRQGVVLADDFLCTSTGPITDIYLWGSWLSNSVGTVTNFWIGIYNDVPAVTNFSSGKITPSHPGTNLLWQQSFTFGQYVQSPGPTGIENFYNPTNNTIMGPDNMAWEYCFHTAAPFVQQGTAANPTNYWLAVRAQLPPDNTLYGWKTSLVPYHDAAVWGTVNAAGLPSGDWQSMINPSSQKQIDLSFKLETPTNTPPPPTGCVETNGVKYDQEPNLFGGLDVWNSSVKPSQIMDNPWWVADDFKCTTTGPITDIHLWGSWQNDAALPGSITFQLYVFDDVPGNAANPNSHPGTNVIWHQTFTPGSYSETIWTNGAQESFYDSGLQVSLGPDTVVWYYCFNPTNLVQTGTAAQPTNYWLAAFAELPAGIPNVYGWKTTTSVRNDISVHSPWLGFGVPPSNAWIPNYLSGGPAPTPFDMAFKLTTQTNQCVIPIACSPVSSKTVSCSTAWTFDPPVVTPVPCCSNPMVVFMAVTNSYACSNIITGTWTVFDCNSELVGSCTETVTVIESGFTFTCTTNKTVACGSSWIFDPPTAVDHCSGAKLPIMIVSTVTNVQGPCQETITRTWLATNSCGAAATCSQTVTNVAINPPIISCSPGKTVTNGTPWMFDPPTAVDACSGATVPVIVFNTITNGQGPCNQIFTRTWSATDQCGNTAYCSQTVTNVCVPVVCVESDYDKYVQWPNILGGYDVWNNPYVLADDFVCTNTGPVSDIHLWGSWNGNQALPGTITFWLGIYDDVPVGSGNQYPYSHPGTNLLWQQWFAPGQYAETIWTANASELFLDPGSSNVIGTDSMVWYYCFYPTNAFMQMGSAKTNKVYWLAAYAQLPPGDANDISGWKTTTNVLHDVSVHAIWPGIPPVGNPGWKPTAYQPAAGGPAVPLDLAFKLTTCGPVTIKYLSPTNVVVSWVGGGTLQAAPTLLGPWADVPGNPPSPYKDSAYNPTNHFYRLRCYP